MLEKIKDKICHPIIAIVCLVLAIGSIIAFAIVKNHNQSKADLIAKVDIAAIVKDKDTGKLSAVTIDDKKEQQLKFDVVNKQFQKIVNPEKNNTDIIDAFIEARYNFDNGAASFDDQRKEKIKNCTTDNFYQTIISAINAEKTISSNATVIKRFINGREETDSDVYIDVLKYLYVVEINGKQTAIAFDLKGEKGKWRISSATTISTIEGGTLW